MTPGNSLPETLPVVKTVVLAGNSHQDDYVGRIIEFIALLLGRAIKVVVRTKFRRYLESLMPLPAAVSDAGTPPLDADAAVSIGGDGTFLKTARWIGDSGIPILGLNTGHLGFLANYSIDEISDLLDALIGGRATIEPRSLLELDCPSVPGDASRFALNEVAVLKEETSSMITSSVTVDSDFLADYLADGLVIATSTGSTAYNLSVGGPILQPSLRSIVLSPVAPHTLTLRPIVVAGDSEIRVVVSSRAKFFRVSVDGNSFTMPCGELLTIRRAPFDIFTIRRPGDNFASTLRGKLLWGRR